MIQELREKLLEAYNEFVKKFGRLNSRGNKSLLSKDPHSFTILSSLEVKSGPDWLPADVLLKSNKGEDIPYKTDSPTDALSWCLGTYGVVSLPVICAALDRDETEVLHELEPLLYWEPVKEEWQTADKYLANNVYVKWQEAQRVFAQNTEDLRVKRSLEAIAEVQPEQIPFELLEWNCGERWIPIHMYERFICDLFDIPEGGMKLHYFPSTDMYKLEINYKWQYAKVSTEFRVDSKGRTTLYGDDLMEYALMNIAPYITYTEGTGENKVTLPDNDAIQLANDKIEQIRTAFTEWIGMLPEEDKKWLVDTYNNLYNCYVIRKYNGSHMRFPGLDMKGLQEQLGVTKLHDSQVDTAWRIVQDTGAIIDHEVGSGKSLICVLAAHEMKRMGIRRKPAILCLKANVSDIAKTYRIAYPNARILTPGEQDFEKKNRMRLFHEMRNNDWDCIIMTHDQFGKIPQSARIQINTLQEEIDNLTRDLDEVKRIGGQVSKSLLGGLEKRKANLGFKLQWLKADIQKHKDDTIDFEQIGIDHLFIDEAHKFKNLMFTTRHDRVAGLGNAQGSQRAMNMLFAIRTLQEKFNSDLQATFLSGTPISNSLTEMYLLFKYLRPRELARQNILNFDSWAAVFAKKTIDFEFTVTNQIIAKERFRHFIKVPELALFYNEIADYRTNKSINIDKPDTCEELVPLTPTEDQKDFIERLINFAKTGIGEYIYREPLTESEDKARMLIATNYAKKMSTDMRLIDPVIYDDHPGNKITVCCSKVVEFYHRFRENKGTQIIFCDLGTPHTKAPWNVYDAILEKLITVHGLPKEEIAFIHDYNEKSRPKLFRQINNGEIRILLASTDKGGTGVNVQERVVAIHDLDIPWKPAELEQRGGRGARQGNWLAKLEQNNLVYRFIYAVEQSLDNYKFTLLKNKQLFISQMKRSELSVRSIDEGSFDEQSGMNFAEYIAVLSGDTSLLEKAKIDKKLAVLENLRNAHYKEVHRNRYALEHGTKRLVDIEEMLVGIKRDYELYSSNVTRDEIGVKNNPILLYEIDEEVKQLERDTEAADIAYDMEKQVRKAARMAKMSPGVAPERRKVKDPTVFTGDWLIRLHAQWRPSGNSEAMCIGELLGFKLWIKREANSDSEALLRGYSGGTNIMESNKFYAQHPDGGIKYVHNNGVPQRENSKMAARCFLQGIDRCENVLNTYLTEQKELIRQIAALSSVQEKPFGREEELHQLREDSKKLEKEIGARIKAEAAIAV